MKPKVVLGLVIVTIALFAAVYLVRNNQNLVGKASTSETGISFLPTSLQVEVGKNLSVAIVVNPGSPDDSLVGVNLELKYDPTVLRFVGGQSLGNMTGVNIKANQEGTLKVLVVAMGSEQKGALQVAKIDFQAVNGGKSNLVLNKGSLLVSGQTREYGINYKQNGVYTVLGGNGGGQQLTPTMGKINLDVNGNGAIELSDLAMVRKEAIGELQTKKGDLNKDGVVNSADVALWIATYNLLN